MPGLRHLCVPFFALIAAASAPAPAQSPSCATSWPAIGGRRASLPQLRHWLENCPLDTNSQAARIRIRALERAEASHPRPAPPVSMPPPGHPARIIVCPGDARCPRNN